VDDVMRQVGDVTSAQRVVSGPVSGTPSGTPHNAWLRRTAAAAAIALTLGGGTRYYMHRQVMAEAQRVEAEVVRALQITSEKLDLIQRKVYDSQPDTR
jgi:hypothetical protein